MTNGENPEFGPLLGSPIVHGSKSGVRVAEQLIDPVELTVRFDGLRRQIASAKNQVLPPTQPGTPADLPRRLRELADQANDRSLQRHPGMRGYVAFSVKRIVRRLTAWYVEPMNTRHAELAASMAELAGDTAARLEDLERRVGVLDAENRRLILGSRQHAVESAVELRDR
jgi:hypothetical protein